MAFMAPLITGSIVGTSTAAGATMASVGATIGSALPFIQAGSTLLGLVGSSQQASAQEAVAKANQRQLNAQAKQEEAASQREATQRRRQSDLMMSRAIAVAAASGAGTSGIEGILEGIAGEGEQAAQYALYEGTERAKGLRYRGAVGRSEAKASSRATLLGGFSQAGSALFSRFAV